MQLRWFTIGVVCFSAALLSACGGAPGTALTSRSDASAMSKAAGRYDSNDKDDCDEDHDKSQDKSSSLSVQSKDDDKECKDSDDHDKSKDNSSSLSSSLYSRDQDHDGGDDANCKVTICHIPPGNACREHTIRIGKSAVPAHIAHGDYPGACDAPPPPPPPPANSCNPAACPGDPNGSAMCNPDGSCGIVCLPLCTWNAVQLICNCPA
jgi:hypothetical protein